MPGTTAYPAALDTATFPDIDGAVDTLDAPPHDDQHNNAAAAILAIETKLGINNSAVETSIDYRVVRLEGIVDAIIDNLGPAPVLLSGAFNNPREVGDTLTGSLTITGGWAPYSVAVQSGTAPAGASFGISGMTVVSTGTLPTAATYNWVMRCHASDGSFDDIACSVTVDVPGTCTWSPANASFTLSETNLRVSWGSTNVFGAAYGSIARAATGSWYYEIEVMAAGDHDIMVGIARPTTDLTDPYSGANGFYYYTSPVNATYAYRANGGATILDTGYAKYTAADVIGVLLKNGKVYFSKNNVWQDAADVNAETGFAFSGITGDMYPSIVCYNNGTQLRGKFITASFVGTVPTGAAAWD